MRMKITLSPGAVKLIERARLPVAACVLAASVLAAYAFGAASHGPSAPATVTSSIETPAEEPKAAAESEPLKVPSSAGGARSSGMGGQTWMAGDTGRLSSDFKQSVANEFRGGTLGQAQQAMAGLGFACALGSQGRMQCSKTMQADNCTLTWSVRLQSSRGDVQGAGGEGFSRDCN